MSLLLSQLVSIRVPTCQLERAKLGMSDTVFGDRRIRDMSVGSALCLSRCHACRSCWAIMPAQAGPICLSSPSTSEGELRLRLNRPSASGGGLRSRRH